MWKRTISGIFSVVMILLLILDTKTAISGALDGIETCIKIIIPSLFPFFVIARYSLSWLTPKTLRFFYPVLRRCGVPKGGESIFILGVLGGYPVGASLISNAFEGGIINKATANRMLGFCNNAGPAFIFGMTVSLFENPKVGWCIWLTQVMSAMFVGCITSFYAQQTECHMNTKTQTAFVDCIEDSVKSICKICGCIVFFRVLLTYINLFVGSYINRTCTTFISGLLEISNGCVQLVNLESDAMQYLFMNIFISFGGLCVLLQTKSVAKKLDLQYYIYGSLLKCEISIVLSTILIPILFDDFDGKILLSCALISLVLMLPQIILWLYKKKVVANRKNLLYNYHIVNRKGA